MRTTLSAKQWSRLRAYVNSLDAQAKKDLLHRCGAWTLSVGKELSRVADGGKPGVTAKVGQALSEDMVSQVAVWLKK